MYNVASDSWQGDRGVSQLVRKRGTDLSKPKISVIVSK